jgi:MFS family permease
VVAVTFAFGLGQPALMSVVGSAVPDDVRGVALGLATLMFLVGGGVGSAVVGGLSSVVGMSGSLLLLAGLALVGLSSLTPLIRRAPQLT